MSLSTKILIGMGLGIVVGVFFGEEVAFLDVVGVGFIQLLQMSVLPFVTVSLIVGLGRLTYDDALSLAKKCGAVLLLLWVIAIAVVVAMPLAFPDWKSASFFSPSLVEQPGEVDFLQMYIPANPFFSLANSIVPAVVVFSIVTGVALIGAQRKEHLLDPLSVALDVLASVTGMVVRLAPIGVFAIAASAAGTMDVEELGRLQVFLLVFISISFVLTFWVLPVLVTTLTPLRYRDVLLPVRSALITAFATGNLMIVLPILTERGREVIRDAELGSEDLESVVDVIVPTSFTFPTIGLLLSLSFVPFAGWYIGSSLSAAQYPSFLVSGLVSLFGGSIVAMPFLLDLVRIPADMFQLFVTVDVFTGRFGTLLAAMHLWVMALLGAWAMAGRIRVRWARVARYALVSLVLTVATAGAVRVFFTHLVGHAYTGYRQFIEMDLATEPVGVKLHDKLPPPITRDAGKSRLQVIRGRRSLRVCYYKDSLPFAFMNAKGKLVGFDAEMAHELARDLGVSLEFAQVKRADVHEELDRGICDIVMSGYVVSPGRSERMALSTSYMDVTVAFLVEDYRRDDFTSWQAIADMDDLRIGLPGDSHYYRRLMKRRLSGATIVPVDSPREFLRGERDDIDGFLHVAEAASAWTLVYPQYTVAVPMPDPMVIPLAYPMPRDERDLVKYVNTWVELRKKDKTVDRVFDLWILGKAAARKEPRWSVIRDVLNWVD